MDKKIERITKKTFSEGSVRDAAVFLEMCVKNAFSEFHFRGLEITNLMPTKQTVEGKSWNHVLKVKAIEINGKKAWEVSCHRVSHGETADKKAFLDPETLDVIV